jgi:transcriptional regulator with XRE-family HTH domain
MWKRSFSQAELAARAELNQSTISLFENGYVNLDADELVRLKTALNAFVREKLSTQPAFPKLSTQPAFPKLSTQPAFPKLSTQPAFPQRAQKDQLRSLLGGNVTTQWFAQKEQESQRLRDTDNARATQDRIKDKLIEALRELVGIQNELIAAHVELRKTEATKRAELETRITEYRDLLGLETDAVVARSNADEQREKILSTKGQDAK